MDLHQVQPMKRSTNKKQMFPRKQGGLSLWRFVHLKKTFTNARKNKNGFFFLSVFEGKTGLEKRIAVHKHVVAQKNNKHKLN